MTNDGTFWLESCTKWTLILNELSPPPHQGGRGKKPSILVINSDQVWGTSCILSD